MHHGDHGHIRQFRRWRQFSHCSIFEHYFIIFNSQKCTAKIVKKFRTLRLSNTNCGYFPRACEKRARAKEKSKISIKQMGRFLMKSWCFQMEMEYKELFFGPKKSECISINKLFSLHFQEKWWRGAKTWGMFYQRFCYFNIFDLFRSHFETILYTLNWIF